MFGSNYQNIQSSKSMNYDMSDERRQQEKAHLQKMKERKANAEYQRIMCQRLNQLTALNKKMYLFRLQQLRKEDQYKQKQKKRDQYKQIQRKKDQQRTRNDFWTKMCNGFQNFKRILLQDQVIEIKGQFCLRTSIAKYEK